MKKFTFLKILIYIITILASACTDEPEKEKLVTVDRVVVYKSKRELQLIHAGEVIRTYSIALGDNPVGHKVQEGDERTPEGSYKLDWRNSNSAYHKSIHVSYPNKQDKEIAKKLGVSAGGDIMIHALPKKMSWVGKLHTTVDWTNGCIAVDNDEMDEIWAMVKNGTKIEIYK